MTKFKAKVVGIALLFSIIFWCNAFVAGHLSMEPTVPWEYISWIAIGCIAFLGDVCILIVLGAMGFYKVKDWYNNLPTGR